MPHMLFRLFTNALAAPLFAAAAAFGQCPPAPLTLSGTSPCGDTPLSVAAGDFNLDGRLDMVTANQYSDSVSIAMGLGDGTFAPPVQIPVGVEPYAVVVANIDGGGTPDIVVANHGSNSISVLLNSGTIWQQVDTSVGANPIDIAVGDFNGDSALDLAVALQGAGAVKILLGTLAFNGTFTRCDVPGRPEYHRSRRV